MENEYLKVEGVYDWSIQNYYIAVDSEACTNRQTGKRESGVIPMW
jgi:hypothetical protein